MQIQSCGFPYTDHSSSACGYKQLQSFAEKTRSPRDDGSKTICFDLYGSIWRPFAWKKTQSDSMTFNGGPFNAELIRRHWKCAGSCHCRHRRRDNKREEASVGFMKGMKIESNLRPLEGGGRRREKARVWQVPSTSSLHSGDIDVVMCSVLKRKKFASHLLRLFGV